MKKYFLYILLIFSFSKILVLSSCANIIPPTGGPKDTLPPKLINALPKDSLTSFNAKNIVLTFDEYVQLDNPMENVIVSPNPENQPNVSNKLRTITIKLRDSLLPNTTYSINFGNSIKDVNEGNIKKNFSYIFTTGKILDRGTLSGKVILAETGAIDSTLIVVLQKNSADSIIEKRRPLYYTRLDGKGNFQFRNLPADTFSVYALTDDYTKRYDDSTKLFAFLNNPVSLADSANQTPVTLYAFRQFKEKEKSKSNGQVTSTGNSTGNLNNSVLSSADKKKNEEEKKHLKFETDFDNNRQSILTNLKITFSHKLKTFDTSQIIFTDTNYRRLPGAKISLDTSATIVTLAYNWPLDNQFKLIFGKKSVADSAGNTLSKTDTLSFTTKKETDYGSITLRFIGLDLSRNPVLQMVQNDKVVDSSALTQTEWHRQLYEPGDYQIRILFDNNKNGTWDAGDFTKKKQPEIVIAVSGTSTLHIRNDWENEKEINLNDPLAEEKTKQKNN